MCFWRRICSAVIRKCWCFGSKEHENEGENEDENQSAATLRDGTDDDFFFNGISYTRGAVLRIERMDDPRNTRSSRLSRLRMASTDYRRRYADMFIEMMNTGEDVNNDSDRDRLFEEYVSQSSSQAENYNTELPTEHAYLGKLKRVEGVDFLEPGKIYRIPICGHHSIVYPGETIPLILSTSLLSYDDPDGVKFGLVFWEQAFNNKFYGVTCQVYERDFRDFTAILKTVAQQRFQLIKQKNGTYTKSYSRDGKIGYYADVLILPEITLPDPLLSTCSNNLAKFSMSNNKKQCNQFKKFVSQSTVWPKFVYDQYGTEEVLQKVERFLAFLKISSVPKDPVKLSFWLARNIPINETDRTNIFFANSVLNRMLIINKSLDYTCYFCCKRCELKIGNYNEIFAMSKQGVQTSYCNPSGYVHETLTIYNTIANSTYTIERPSAEFSWFPGYCWQIVLCGGCHCHIGWKFVATKKNFMPISFYGLSGKSISVKSDKKKGEQSVHDFGRLANDDEDDGDGDDGDEQHDGNAGGVDVAEEEQ